MTTNMKNRLGAEQLERRTAPGRLIYDTPPSDPTGGGSGAGISQQPITVPQPGNSGPRRNKLWQDNK